MTPIETVSRLRRLANDWRKEEKQLCEQFGNEIIPRSMRARRIKDAQALEAAVEMIERIPSRIIHKQAPGFVHEYSRESAEGYAHGWNACIKTITEKSK